MRPHDALTVSQAFAIELFELSCNRASQGQRPGRCDHRASEDRPVSAESTGEGRLRPPSRKHLQNYDYEAIKNDAALQVGEGTPEEIEQAELVAQEFLKTDWSQDFDVKAKLAHLLGLVDEVEDWDEPEDVSLVGSDGDTGTETTKSRFFG